MFIENYLDDIHKKLLHENYSEIYLNSLDESLFEENYKLLSFMRFYYIDDLIVRYLEIFEYETGYILTKVLELKKNLGIDYIDKIGENLKLFKDAFEGDNND